MNTMKFTAGQAVYDREGNEYEFVSFVEGCKGFAVVAPIYESDDGEFFPSSPQLIEAGLLTASPVSQRKEAQVAELDEQIRTKRRELADLEAIQRGGAARFKRLTERDEILSRLEDLLDGKVTHYVWITNGHVHIHEAATLADEYEKYRPALLSLRPARLGGQSLEWHINGFSSEDFGFASSKDEAHEVAKKLLLGMLIRLSRAGQLRYGEAANAYKSAKQFGVEVPADIAGQMDEFRRKIIATQIADCENLIKNRLRSIEGHQGDIEGAKREIAKLNEDLAGLKGKQA